MTSKPASVTPANPEADVKIKLTEIPAPDVDGLGALLRRRVAVLRFLLLASGVIRSPVVLMTLAASLARAGLMYGINETARSAGDGVGWSVLAVLGSAVIMLSAGHFKRVMAFDLITRLARDMRQHMSRQLLRANIDFLTSRPHGQVYAAMTNEVVQLTSATINVIEAFEAALLLAIAIPYLFVVSWGAGLAALVAFALGISGYLLLDRPARRHNFLGSETFAAYCDRVSDMLAGWKELRQRGTRRAAFEAETLGIIDAHVAHRRRSETLYSASTAVGQSAIILLLCFVVVAIPFLQGGDTTQMFQVLTIVFLINGPVELMFNMMPRLARAENAYHRIYTVETALSVAQSRALMVEAPPRSEFQRIELRGVEALVREPEKPDAEPFRLGPVDLGFVPGETVFICGGNGSGKTTLMSLITGLRNPDSGQILLDGVPLAEDTASAYRELFSGVFSGFHLFRRAYGMTEEEVGELEHRVAQLGLSERVQLLGDSFSTTALSAGQSRRLALAVALAEQRPIVVLDEFAADQDPANRAFFYDVLVPELSASGRLVIAITHDDHQFEKCDRLIKMEGGRIVSDERMNGHARPRSGT